jgi:ribosome-binding factor A
VPGFPALPRAIQPIAIMSSRRLDRVNELLKHEIGEIIRRDFNIADMGLVSVNAVARQRLDEQRVRIQGEVGRSIVLKYTPTLTFILDDTIEKANRVLQIIDDIERGDAGSKS